MYKSSHTIRSKVKKQARYRLYVGCTPGHEATCGTSAFQAPPFDPEWVRAVGIDRSPFPCLTVLHGHGVWKEECDRGQTILERSVVFEVVYDDTRDIREQAYRWAESVRNEVLQDAVLLTIERVEAVLFSFDETSRPGLTEEERAGIRKRREAEE